MSPADPSRNNAGARRGNYPSINLSKVLENVLMEAPAQKNEPATKAMTEPVVTPTTT